VTERNSPASDRRRRRGLVFGAAALIALAVAGWIAAGGAPVETVASLFGGDDKDGGGGRPPTAVEIVGTTEDAAVERYRASGRVRAAMDVALAAQASGQVAEIVVEEGARVAAGDPLLRLDDEDRRARIRAAEARLAGAENDLARARELFEENVAAEARVETARTEARTARAELAEARAALDDVTLAAPFAGAVGFFDVDEGDYVQRGEEVAALTTVDRLRIRFSLPQDLASAVEPGDAIRVSQGEGDCGAAEIVTLAPAIAAETRTREVKAAAPTGCRLRAGGFVSVSLPVARREGAVFAPQAAIRREGFQAWVYRVEERGGGLVARRAPVTLGAVRPAAVEIREGLEAGARIVGDGAQRLTDGDRIRPAEGGGRDGGSGE